MWLRRATIPAADIIAVPFARFSRERRKHRTLTLLAVNELRQNGVLRVVFPPAQMIAVLVELRIYRVPQRLVDDGLVLAVVNRAFVPHRSCIKDIGQGGGPFSTMADRNRCFP